MAAQIGFFFKGFDKQLVGASIKFPVNMTNWLTGVVLPVLGELDGEPVHRALMETRDKAFYNLFCNKFYVVVLRDFCEIYGV